MNDLFKILFMVLVGVVLLIAPIMLFGLWGGIVFWIVVGAINASRKKQGA